MRRRGNHFDRDPSVYKTVMQMFDLSDPEQVDVYLRLHRMERTPAVAAWIRQRASTPLTVEIPRAAFEDA